jgi:hypothetical protein
MRDVVTPPNEEQNLYLVLGSPASPAATHGETSLTAVKEILDGIATTTSQRSCWVGPDHRSTDRRGARKDRGEKG